MPVFLTILPKKHVGDIIKTEAGNEFEVTEEMGEAVRIYVDAVYAAIEETGGKLMFEQKFNLKHLHPDLWGTNDACVVSDDVLDIFDFKYGRGKMVKEERNPQLMYYALGALQGYKSVNRVRMTIVQPRFRGARSVRMWELPAIELIKWGDEVLKPAAELALTDKGEPVSGSWCKWCDGAHHCPELGKKAQSALGVDWSGGVTAKEIVVPNVQDQTPAELARLLDFVPLLRNFADAVEAHAKYRLEHGQEVPNHKLIRGKPGKRKWSQSAVAEAEMLKVLGSEIYSPKKFLGPAPIEKLLKARGLTLPDHLITRPEGKLQMVSSDHKEPAVLNAAVEVFKKEK